MLSINNRNSVKYLYKPVLWVVQYVLLSITEVDGRKSGLGKALWRGCI